jgi:hypothetical protein
MLMRNKKTTDNYELEKLGRSFFGNTFIGVFSSDNIVFNDNKKTQYCIANLDTQHGPGTHWISLAMKNGIVYGYDSFGRDLNRLLIVRKKIINSDNDINQKFSERNCGQKSLAWLIMFDKLGPKMALKI